MSTTSSTGSTSDPIRDGDRTIRRTDTARRAATETKASFKTTEFFAYVATVVGVLIAAGVVDETKAGGFGARQAWLYVTILTVGYMISRGFAKSGSREPYSADDHS
jgi:hypothetical protein